MEFSLSNVKWAPALPLCPFVTKSCYGISSSVLSILLSYLKQGESFSGLCNREMVCWRSQVLTKLVFLFHAHNRAFVALGCCVPHFSLSW